MQCDCNILRFIYSCFQVDRTESDGRYELKTQPNPANAVQRLFPPFSKPHGVTVRHVFISFICLLKQPPLRPYKINAPHSWLSRSRFFVAGRCPQLRHLSNCSQVTVRCALVTITPQSRCHSAHKTRAGGTTHSAHAQYYSACRLKMHLATELPLILRYAFSVSSLLSLRVHCHSSAR